MIITVTPAPSLDRTYHVVEFGLGLVNRASSSVVEASGKGVNVSRALAAAGTGTLAVLPLGGAEGRQLAELLDGHAVPYRGVPTGVSTRTNTTLALAGRPTTKINAPAPVVPDSVWDAVLEVVSETLKPEDWILCSGSVPVGAEQLAARLIALARERGARSAVDSSGPALVQALAAGPDLLAPNHLELAELVGADVSGLDPDGAAGDREGEFGGLREGDAALISAAARWSAELSGRTGAAILATLGASGAVYTDAAGSWHAIAPPVVPVNTVGAGDALLAGFLSVAGRSGWHSGLVALAEGALATSVAWGTSACAMPETSGDVAVGADVAAVRVRPVRVRPSPSDRPLLPRPSSK